MRKLLALIACIFSAALTNITLAADFPTRTVRLVVPYSPGGTADLLARHVAEKLTNEFNQTVIVENKTGAGGNIASAFVAQSKPDGYTLLFGSSGSNTINPSLFDDLPFDAKEDLVLIAPVAKVSNMIVVRADSPITDIEDLSKAQFKKAKSLSFGSSGIGTVGHLAGEVVRLKVASELIHVPYPGGPQALTDLLGGHIDMFVANTPSVAEHVKTGKLKALALISAMRSKAFPDLPTLKESDIDDPGLESWYAIMGPAKMPNNILLSLNTAVANVVNSTETENKFGLLYADVFLGRFDLNESNEFYSRELDKWSSIIKNTGVTMR